jgi:YXWGXW repeat-containing protein
MLPKRFTHSMLLAFMALIVSSLAIIATPRAALAQVSIGVSVRIAPPALPIYEQPVCPGDGYIWTPGYWSYGPDGYYWVPGTWVLAPTPGFLWTPGYWGWGGGAYLWHAGYWGPHVGFYGGVNYGFGYVGVGYAGGFWNHGVFNYNRSVNNINVTNVHNVYNKTVINNVTVNRVSYNGGAGGTNARPGPQEEAAAHDRHVAATPEQSQHEHAAASNRAQFASVNGGRPAVAATARPGDFNHAVPARTGGAPNNVGANRGTAYRPPANAGGGNQPVARNANPGGNAARPNGGQPNYRPNGGNPNANSPNRGNNADRATPPARNIPPASQNGPRGGGQPRPGNAPHQNAPRQQDDKPQRGGGEPRGGGDRPQR